MFPKFIWPLLLAVVTLGGFGCGPQASLRSPGTLFLRQPVDSYKTFHEAFLAQAPRLKQQGFWAYSLHQDLSNPKAILLTLACSDLQKGLDFVRSDYFLNAMNKAGAGVPSVWWGLDLTARVYRPEPHMKGGIVVARNEVRSLAFWKKGFDAEGPHNHAGRHYVASNRSVHAWPAKGEGPAVVIVAHQASDVRMAPAFMDSPSMRGEMEALGVTGLELWYGKNIEQGLF
ncbi:MAG TPA: hypothetical protein VMU88_11240 [bacterium]|nr:hypothetical protein [bacterium]